VGFSLATRTVATWSPSSMILQRGNFPAAGVPEADRISAYQPGRGKLVRIVAVPADAKAMVV